MTTVVADSTPLNYLAILSDFHLLRQLYGSLVIPPAVFEEVVTRGEGHAVRREISAALGHWVTIAAQPSHP